MLNEATEDNLIDLGPGSPAVVTPRITSSPHLQSTTGATASPTHNPSTTSLSSALASLGKKSALTQNKRLCKTTENTLYILCPIYCMFSSATEVHMSAIRLQLWHLMHSLVLKSVGKSS